MKNLTKEQKEIISNLTNEFESLNANEASTSGLIDVGGVRAEYDLKQKTIAEIKINNEQFEKIAYDMAKADYDRLKDDIDKLGLSLKIFRGWRTTLTIKQGIDELTLIYEPELKTCHITDEMKTMGIIRESRLSLKSYQFASLEEFCENIYFKRKLKRMYESKQFSLKK